jgi:lauroyl/myristoyl acyltransferase
VTAIAARVRGQLVSAGTRLVAALPEAPLRVTFRLAGDFAWARHGRGVRQLETNLQRVTGAALTKNELRRLSRQAMRSYARYWLEFLRLPELGHDRILGRMHVEGEQFLADAMALGRGAILALPHAGNWDHAGAWVALRGYPFTTVAERLEPASVFDRFVAIREQLGMEVLPLTGGDRNSFAVLMQRLRAGKLVCLVAERDLGDGGVEVSFFGGATRMPPGPAALALTTGAALLPVVLWFTPDGGPGGGWGARITQAIEVPAEGDRKAKIATMTQRLADDFAAGIAEHPADWHMLQRLWLADFAVDSGNPDQTDKIKA